MIFGSAPSSAASIPFLRLLSSTPTLTLTVTVTPTPSLLKTPTPSVRHFFSRSHRFFPFAHTPIATAGGICGCFPNSIRIRVSAMSTGAGLVEFSLSPTSSLKIQKGDITQWSVDGSSDAIVTFSPAVSVFWVCSWFSCILLRNSCSQVEELFVLDDGSFNMGHFGLIGNNRWSIYAKVCLCGYYMKTRNSLRIPWSFKPILIAS